MKKSLFEDLLFSVKEAKEMGLIIDEKFCCFCERTLPDKKYKTMNGCLWCDTNYYLKGDKNGQK